MCVNGVQIPLEKPQTLLGFLKEQGYNIHRIAVERNEKIEVVSFMGGGPL